MEKSINALLNSNLRVIIPDFGAFIIRQKEPRIVVFNEFLRYNDGLLTGYVAKNESVDLEIANQLVSDFTTGMTKVLESGKSYTIEGLGVLHKDSTGKIIFDNEVQGKPAVAVRKTGTKSRAVTGKTVKPVRRTTKSAVKPAPARAKKVEAPEIIEPVPEPVVIPDRAIVKEPDKPAVPAEAPVVAPVEAPVEAIVEEHPVETQVTKSEPAGSKPFSNQTNLILRWIILFLIADAVIFAWFIFGDKFKRHPKEKKAETGIMDSVFERLSDSVRNAATDTALIFREASESASAGAADSKENLRYYIVAGCFRDEINADDLVKSLKDKGFNAEKFGKIGNLYAVSFASFDDKETAVAELKRIREEIHPEAWMTRF